METIRSIKTEEDYRAALARIDALMEADLDTPEGQELDVLADLVELHESRHFPMELPNPIEAIRFRMEQQGLSNRDLIPYLGSSSRVSEVLSGKRQLTISTARALHTHLGIPGDSLLGASPLESPSPIAEIEWARFPIREMVKRGWIAKIQSLKRKAKEVIEELMVRAHRQDPLLAAHFRKNDQNRVKAQVDTYALSAWCLEVLARAAADSNPKPFQVGTVTPEFLAEVARFSPKEDGPRLATAFLRENGIRFVYLPHLPKTHLDGAALQLDEGTPVVGLTLRHDRIDNFWFCLLHELAHIGRHMDPDHGSEFVDDLTLRGAKGAEQSPLELEADEWASEALVPKSEWSRSRAREEPNTTTVLELAQRIGIHPAIVAGRVRFERDDYRLLSHFVGKGEIRKHFQQN